MHENGCHRTYLPFPLCKTVLNSSKLSPHSIEKNKGPKKEDHLYHREVDFYSGTKVCQNSAFGLFLKRTWTNRIHSGTMKIRLYTKVSRLRAAPRHGVRGVFFEFSHRSAAVASLLGRRYFLYSGRYKDIGPDFCNSFNTCITHVNQRRAKTGIQHFHIKCRSCKGGGPMLFPSCTLVFWISQCQKEIILPNSQKQFF